MIAVHVGARTGETGMGALVGAGVTGAGVTGAGVIGAGVTGMMGAGVFSQSQVIKISITQSHFP